MITKMAAHFTSRIDYNITSTRYPAPRAEWNGMSVRQKMDEKLLGGSSIKEVIRKFDPDVVYSDSPLYAAQFDLASFLSRKKLPLVLHLRGDIWREHWAAFVSASARRRLLMSQQSAYDWAAITLCAKVTPICQWLQRIVEHHMPWKRCEVVYQGVDPDEFRADGASAFEVRKPAVAIVQNHSVSPKVQGLLSFRDVIKKLPQVQFYIAEGEAWAQQFLPAVKEHFGGLPNVHFVQGITSAKAVSRMITACSCYVLASGLDCCPTTVLEASLLEKPVLASRVGGVPETVEEGYTGWTIDNGNVHEWVQKIDMLANDTPLCSRLGRQGREWVSERFGWTKIARQVERLIVDEVMGDPL